jgi:protein-tyrosine phosphatase
MKSILVVCEGNICRSPMAQGLLAAALAESTVLSAGLNALSGMPADETAIRLLQARGIDIGRHRATQLTREMCSHAELVLVMSSAQREHLEEAYPFTRGRVFRICEHTKRDVPDPYRQSERVFVDALKLIDEGTDEWLRRIRQIRSAQK